MFTITIEGETLDDVIIRCRGLYQALTGSPAPLMGEQPATAPAPSAPEVDPPATGKGKGRGKKKTQAEIAAELPGETIVEPDAEHAEPEFDAVEAAGIKEKALDKIRAVYAFGPAGAAAVTKLGKDYGVKKLGDVPLERAAELLADITKIEKTVAKDAPI